MLPFGDYGDKSLFDGDSFIDYSVESLCDDWIVDFCFF
jgi:hypothetical protein